MDLDAQGQVQGFEEHGFSVKMLSENLSQKEAGKIEKKDNHGKSDPFIEYLVLSRENSTGNLILGEQRFRTIEKGRNVHFEHLHFNHILAAKLMDDGSLAWMHRLVKFQRGRPPKQDMSFNRLTRDNKHYLFYMDNEKNLDLAQSEIDHSYVTGRGGYLAALVIDDMTGKTRDVVYQLEGTNAFIYRGSTPGNESGSLSFA